MADTSLPSYPWYAPVSGDEIAQGDILEDCSVYSPRDEDIAGKPAFDWAERDVIILTQSCDLVKGREKVSAVLVCPLFRRSDIRVGHLSTPKGLEDARRGNLPAFHILAACDRPDCEREVSVVDFHFVWSLPIPYVRKRLAQKIHLRLLPPYREHLSQAFARYFMRVGLPVDIPPFLPEKQSVPNVKL